MSVSSSATLSSDEGCDSGVGMPLASDDDETQSSQQHSRSYAAKQIFFSPPDPLLPLPKVSSLSIDCDRFPCNFAQKSKGNDTMVIEDLIRRQRRCTTNISFSATLFRSIRKTPPSSCANWARLRKWTLEFAFDRFSCWSPKVRVSILTTRSNVRFAPVG